MSKSIEIAEEIVLALNAGGFSQSFTAERRCLPKYDVGKDKNLQVQVVPASAAYAIETRGLSSCENQISIGFLKKVEDPEAEIPDLLTLVEDVAVFIKNRPMAGANWLKTNNEILYDPKFIETDMVFLSVLAITYKGIFA